MKDFARLTLEEKAGQLFFLGFQRSVPDADAVALFDELRPGGIIFFQRNMETLDQLYALACRLRDMHGVPLFLATDHEGGSVDRLKHLFSPMPRMSDLAALGIAHVRAGARVLAQQLEAAGFNLNFSPVLDLGGTSIMSGRALSSAPIEVSRIAAAFVDEVSRRGIISCVKHFPGLGAATRDPHFALPHIEKPKRQLLQEDMLPFLNLFDDVGMVMVSHAHYPGLGDERPTPASLSSKVVGTLLRKKLGFGGVIITDDLTMGAISSVGLTPDLFLRAFEAGNDMLLFSEATPLVHAAFRTIVRAVRSSEILRRRLDESVTRILQLKQRIQYVPVRHRAHIRVRVNRQIDKLQSLVEHARAGRILH